MALTKNFLVLFLLTILFVTPYVHCSDKTLGIGDEQNSKSCFSRAPCVKAETQGCMAFCRKMSLTYYGECTPTHCCCLTE
ncbi:hypothetical protein CARUB_v10028116mg [Capsella rubella]|uniref:Knottin scorpion toxin-like domain-containing protein n=1 Tax=Capsella rubella TaxID=81985 RepID=R0GDL6_9BRAS|nr:hypothetical protein CARUB_v10028116mg [Capsella rubella]